MQRFAVLHLIQFQSTLPMRGATLICVLSITVTSYFNPHSPCGERPNQEIFLGAQWNFNPHSPCGERLSGHWCAPQTLGDFNPHSPCGERPRYVHYCTKCQRISIHTPHAGSDAQIRALQGDVEKFQSTLPMRGATAVHNNHLLPFPISIHTPHAGSDTGARMPYGQDCYFNPHSPCGERRQDAASFSASDHFNPHSPCGERRICPGRPPLKE